MIQNNFHQIRETILTHSRQTDHKNPSDHYRLDRYDAREYFEINKKWQEKIQNYFMELRSNGEKAVHVDICGRATANTLGADISYCFSLKTPSLRRSFEPNNVFIDGDLFNTSDFSKLLKRLNEDNANPALVTFEPVAGLASYNHANEHLTDYMKITYGRLEKRLHDMIQILRPGGFVYMEKPFQSDGIADFFLGKAQKDYEMSIYLKKFARQHKCRIEITPTIDGPHFLLNKGYKKSNKQV